MASKPRLESLEIVLTQVLVAILTLFTLIPLYALMGSALPNTELVVGLIVFGAWSLVISLATSAWQKRSWLRESGDAP